MRFKQEMKAMKATVAELKSLVAKQAALIARQQKGSEVLIARVKEHSDLYESVSSAPCSVVPCSTSPSAPPSAYSATLASALREEAAPARS
jgi:hypothetical protein